MIYIDNYIKQHDEIIVLIKELSFKISTENNMDNIKDIRELISKISGKLKIHLALEDKNLYPELLKSNRSEVVSKANLFIKEMGDLSDYFHKYIERWSNYSKINSDYNSFIKETEFVIEAITNRIEKENTMLYTLLTMVRS